MSLPFVLAFLHLRRENLKMSYCTCCRRTVRPRQMYTPTCSEPGPRNRTSPLTLPSRGSPSTPPRGNPYPDLSHCRSLFRALDSSIKAIIRHVLCCVWFLSFTIAFARVIPAAHWLPFILPLLGKCPRVSVSSATPMWTNTRVVSST